MKPTLILLCLLISFQSFGQEKTKQFPKHSIGFQFQGNYSYRSLKINKNVPETDIESLEGLIQSRNKDEQGGFGFNLGINYLLKLHKNIALDFGLQLVGRNIRHKDVSILGGPTFIEIGKATSKEINLYVDLPFKVNYFFLNKEKFSVFASSGVSTGFYLSTRYHIKADYYDGTSETIKETSKNDLSNTVILSYIASVGFDYMPKPALRLRIEPIAQVALFNSLETPIKYFPYTFGLNTGLMYNF